LSSFLNKSTVNNIIRNTRLAKQAAKARALTAMDVDR